MNITERIEEMMARKGMTKRLVSQRMGKFNQGFNKLITNPKWQTIEEIAAVLEISVQELLFDTPTPAPATPAEDAGSSIPQEDRPDLIVIDRKTGETKNYYLK